MSQPPSTWPQRPIGFYTDWTVFCTEVLLASLRRQNDTDWLPVVLLAGGAALGAVSMIGLIEANRDIVDRKGQEWGIENLSSLAKGGGALLGTALGGASGALLMRILSRHASAEKVDALSHRLNSARRDYEELNQDLQAGRMTRDPHMAAVEYLFWRLEQAR